MHVVKTALRESFDNIHVGFLYSSKDETIKIETDRGKIGGEKMLHIFVNLTTVSFSHSAIYTRAQTTFFHLRSSTVRSGLNSPLAINAKEPPCVLSKTFA